MATRVLYAVETTTGQNGPATSADTVVGKSSADLAIQIATVSRGNAGAAALWTDNNVTSITVGGGTTNSSISLMGTGTGTVGIGNATAGAVTVTSGGGITLAGGSSEIDLTTTGLLDLNANTATLDTTTTLIVTAGSTLDLDAAGALSINSSAGVINVGDDAVAQAINIGTGAAARTITLGNTTGATVINLIPGATGAVQVNTLPLPSILVSQTGVDLTATGSTGLYTVPAGKSAIITGAYIVPTTATTPGGDAVISLGTNSATFDNIVDGEVLTGLDAITELYHIVTGAGVIHLAAAAEVVTFIVDTADTGSALTSTIHLLGFLI